jgi:hypothetical protein
VHFLLVHFDEEGVVQMVEFNDQGNTVGEHAVESTILGRTSIRFTVWAFVRMRRGACEKLASRVASVAS